MCEGEGRAGVDLYRKLVDLFQFYMGRGRMRVLVGGSLVVCGRQA